MADPVDWPAVLPACPQDWQESDNPDILRSGVDVGLPKVRRRSTLLNQSVSVQWTFKAELYDAFQLFYQTTTLQGTVPFLYRHPVTGDMNAYLFSEPPQKSFIPGKKGVGFIRVNATLELQE